MALSIELNPTITGGSATVLTSQGQIQGGKDRWLFPTHTYLKPNMVDFSITPPVVTDSDSGQASALIKLTVANREQETGCCTITSGHFIADLKLRFSMNQDSLTVGADGLAELRALVNEPDLLEGLLFKGVRPQP